MDSSNAAHPSSPQGNNQPEKNLYLRKKKQILLAALVVIVVSLALIFTVANKTSQKSRPTTNTSTESKQTSSDTTEESKKSMWVLQRKNPHQTITTFDLSDGISNRNIVRWKELLFYQDPHFKKLMSYNLQTGEMKDVYEASRSGIKSIMDNRAYEPYIADLSLVNDTLFFSVGIAGEGFTGDGASYAFDLPITTDPQKLIDFPGEVKKIGSHYFIERVDGADTCGARGTYATIDIITKKTMMMGETSMYCRPGEEFLTVDKRNRMLRAYNTGDDVGPPDIVDQGIYEYIVATSLINPSLKEDVIAKQDMPQNIVSIEYLENKDQLLLIGKAAYVYDFTTKNLQKLFDFPKNWKTVWVDEQKGNSVCIQYPMIEGQDAGERGDYTHGAEIDLVTNRLITQSSLCPQTNKNDFASETQKILTEKIKALQLSSSYELVQAAN